MTKPAFTRGLAALAVGTILAGAPFALTFDGHGPAFATAKAFAKDGRGGDDRGSDDRGGNSGRGGGDDRGDDDRGGDDRDDHGDDDHGGDDRGRDDRGGDDDRGDDRGRDRAGSDHRGDDDSGRGRGRGRGGDDSRGRDGAPVGSAARPGAAGGSSDGGLQVVKVERSGGSVEVVYSNGVKEEIEGGRYEYKNAAGRTVVERPATQADLARIGANVRNSGLLPAARDRGGLPPRLPAGSQAASVEVGRGEIEVRYTTGWKEEISAGRYQLKDPNNNTVVERPATSADRRRLIALANS